MTKATKSSSPPTGVARAKICDTSSKGNDAASPSAPKERAAASCLGKTASKSEIADQIGLHLRSVYDDILAQPVPGRFLELLRKLESSSGARSSKDGM